MLLVNGTHLSATGKGGCACTRVCVFVCENTNNQDLSMEI